MKLTPAKTLALAGIVAVGSFIFTSKLMENRQIVPAKPPQAIEKTVIAKKPRIDYMAPPVRTVFSSYGKKDTPQPVVDVASFPSFAKNTLKSTRSYLVSKGFDADSVDSLLSDPRVGKVHFYYPKADTLKGKMTYARYKAFFELEKLTPKGVQFYLSNQAHIDSMEAASGVPALQVLAHYGIESIYGDSTGSRLAINVLLTRMETSPKRMRFALSELGALLRLCRKYNKDPLEVYGSVWAAITPAQAIPTSLESFDKRHPCTSFEELISARNSIDFIFDYLSRSGATVKTGFQKGDSNYKAAYAYNHSDWYALLVMEFAVVMEARLVAEKLNWPAKTGVGF